MVGQEAGSGLWSGVSGVPGEFSLFREFLPESFLSFGLEALNTTFLGFLCCGCFYVKVFIFCLGSFEHYISRFSLLWRFLPESFYRFSWKF